MKILIVVIVSIAGTLGVVFGLGAVFRRSALGGQQEVTAVRTEPAARSSLVEVVSVPGEVQPEQKIQISSRVPAQILDLPHKEGEQVTGFIQKITDVANPSTRPAEPPDSAVLVRLDARDLQSALRSTEARAAAQEAEKEVAKLRVEAQRATITATAATLADAELELSREEKLLATGDVAQQAVDQARTKAEELRGQIAAARHSLAAEEANLIVLKHNIDASQAEIARAREQLAYTVITSPIAGTVIKVNSKIGESVVPGIQGSPGSVILEVADLSRMLMIGRADEASISQVKVGQKATVRMQAYRDEVFQGTVQSVALAKADERQAGMMQSRSPEGANYYEVRILLKTDGRRIFCGLNADADIETNRHDGIKVPSQAVLGRPVDGLPEDLKNRPEVDKGKQFVSVVYRLVDGKAVVTPVKVGPSDETHTLIESGLKDGDPVIVGPYKILDQLQHDQKVKADGPTTQPTTRPVTAPATQAAGNP